jgi:heat shock protein HslJ
VADQPKYTITFKPDQTFTAKADCNNLSGTWQAGAGNALTLKLGPSTLIACAEGSYGDLYVIALGKVASYAIASSQLTLTLTDQGTLVYAVGK